MARCAFIAAALAALAATSAAADTLKLGAPKGGNSSAAGSHKDWIEVQSYTIGHSRADPRANGEWIADVERPQSSGSSAGSGGTNAMRMEDSAGKEKSGVRKGQWITDAGRPATASVGGSQTMTVGGGRTEARKLPPELPVMAGLVESSSGKATGKATANADNSSGQATGKRQHMPIRSRSYTEQSTPSHFPGRGVDIAAIDGQISPGPGTLTVRGSLPGCRAGAAYDDAVLESRAGRHELTDVVISNCAPDSVSLNYAKVKVRGWDPAKKQE